jgi:aryl-alcohol dehydrogenase-like predicted oxidoreductase
MRYRRLGRSGLEVPVVSFGAWAIGGWNWGGSDDEAAVEALRVAHGLGMDAIDTAPVYGFGRSERVVGRAIRDLEPPPQVWTKVGLRWDDTRGKLQLETQDEERRAVRIFCNARADSVRLELERSLERLGVAQVDLLQVHWPDPTTPLSETMAAMARLVREGRVRAIGVSNFTVAMLEEAESVLGDGVLASDQARYSLVRREIEADVLPWVRAHEVGLLCYSPLEQGLLSGKVTAERRRAGRSPPPGERGPGVPRLADRAAGSHVGDRRRAECRAGARERAGRGAGALGGRAPVDRARLHGAGPGPRSRVSRDRARRSAGPARCLRGGRRVPILSRPIPAPTPP